MLIEKRQRISYSPSVKTWLRSAAIVLCIALAAFAVGVVFGDWRLDGHAQVESFYLCRSSGDPIQPPQLPASSVTAVHLCGAASGSTNLNVAVYVVHDKKTVYASSVKILPGPFNLAVPIAAPLPPGEYRVELIQAQKAVGQTEFELTMD